MSIASIFNTIAVSELNIKISETFYKLNIEVIIDSFYKINPEFISAILSSVPSRDSIFSFLLVYNDLVDTELENNDIDKFLGDVNDNIAICDEITSTKIKLEISKCIDQPYVSIYSLECFSNYLKSLKVQELLNTLSSKAKLGNIVFEIIDYNSKILANSPSITFAGKSVLFNKDIIKDSSLVNSFKSICNFQTNIEYTFTPDDFCITENVSTEIDLIFNKLKIIYSLIYIFDISNLDGNSLSLNLNGCKCLEIKLSLENLNYDNLKVYYDIYKWLYTDGNINDKIGITRNVLSLYLKNSNSIGLDNSAFTAIQSNYAIYLKDNVEKYLEVKSKIIDTSLSTNTQISQLVDTLASNFIKNLGAIGTFIITIVVMKTLDDKKFEDIFTTDMSIISFILVLISVIYLKYTLKEYDYNKNRIKIFYDRLKLSYTDILVPKDIETIFNKDEYFNEDLKSADEKVNSYKKSWCIMLLTFEIGVIILGFLIKV